jgi:hypothetical protein
MWASMRKLGVYTSIHAVLIPEREGWIERSVDGTP